MRSTEARSSRRSQIFLIAFLGFAFALFGCAASTTPLTEYGYSSWASRYGANVKGEFERARQECFERLQISDPASVVKDSPLEKRFASCMQAKGWCSDSGSCR